MIKQQIEQDLKTAMLAGDKRLVEVLRGAKSVILNGEVAAGTRSEGMDDQTVIGLLQKESKKRADAIELYRGAGETERADKEAYEQQVIDGYLPAMLSEEEVSKIVDNVIAGLSEVPTKQQMGQIIGAVKQQTAGLADGAMIARLVQTRLSIS